MADCCILFFQETCLHSGNFWAFWCWKLAIICWMWSVLQRKTSGRWVVHGVKGRLFFFLNWSKKKIIVCDCKYTFKFMINLFYKCYFINLNNVESCAFVRGLLAAVLHLCDAGAKLHGSLGQDGRLTEAQSPCRHPQEEFLADSSRKRQIGFLPHGKRIQVAHHVFVQVRKPAESTEESAFNLRCSK